MSFESKYPYNGETIASYPAHTPEQLQDKLKAGHRAFQALRQAGVAKRAEWMRKVAELLNEQADRHAELITREMGKTLKEAKAEVLKCASTAEYYAGNIENMLEPRIIASNARKSYVAFEPKGIILAIMPWNFPYWQVFRFAIPNLLAGNAAVLKHASNVSGCSLAIAGVFLEAGFPEGAFQSLLVASKDIGPIIADPRVQGVTLTGSTPAGMSVASLAGKHLKKTVLELGGSDPFIVLNDADLNTAATTAVKARMQNAGQSCIAAKRWIVDKSIAEDFTQQVQSLITSLRQGDPFLPETDLGPMARPDLAKALNGQLQSTLWQGAELLAGGEQHNANFAATLLSGVKPGMTAFDEETFGPLAVVITANDEQDAIRLANNTPFGLGASIWTKDLEKAARLAPLIESGNVFVNAMVRSDARLPFGGIKHSGYGRELSIEGVHEFLNIKTVYIQ
ncbi:NAD-dependent succinate-semialdehyde dehydrogenase [Chitinophaga rhizosphaerae]|uniref:NAD-dependent succinate-semialdehyde dehydrogenase n=1 Tax=Chitinophaga rhizosphaerae TaxID=1864947 RepID=UPI000F811D93|nr:NAD-dependent succinate-semialdehyde dehydrogenase [Chitinophaga rhizosphaerae]